MKSKRIITGLIAALMLVSVCACQKSDTAESGGEAVRLKNYMTETEKNSVSIGELTLLDGDVTEESPDGENTVEIDWWTDKDYRKKYEKDKETNPEMFSEGEYEKLMQDLVNHLNQVIRYFLAVNGELFADEIHDMSRIFITDTKPRTAHLVSCLVNMRFAVLGSFPTTPRLIAASVFACLISCHIA